MGASLTLSGQGSKSVLASVDGLEQLGFVERVPSRGDRWQTLASLTSAGHDVAERATAVLNEMRFATQPLGEFVLDGELTFQLGDELFTRTRGEIAFAPRKHPHTFANLSGTDARTLIICTRAGFERYFDRIAAREAGVEPPPEAAKPVPEVIKVGPPIGDRAGGESRDRIDR